MSGVVLWKGESRLNGDPIVFIATGINGDSANEKTGPMVQTWILRQDMSPIDAVHSGDDVAICGDCPARGDKGKGRFCYVQYGQAPHNIWKTYQAGKYGECDLEQIDWKNPIRLGAYGDPTAVPIEILGYVVADRQFTGYTSQWSDHGNQNYALYCLASVSTHEDKELANRYGWRTYRIRRAGEPLMDGEINCPSDKVKCADCLLCAGLTRDVRDISIEVHGANHIVRNFNVNSSTT